MVLSGGGGAAGVTTILQVPLGHVGLLELSGSGLPVTESSTDTVGLDRAGSLRLGSVGSA